MEELRKLVFEKINYKTLRMSKNDFAVLVEKGAEQGKDEAQMKKLASSCLKELRTFRDSSLALSMLEENDFVSEAKKMHIPTEILEVWCQETETKLKNLQTILAISDQSALREFLAANPGLEVVSQKPLSQFVKVLHKSMEYPAQEFIPVQENLPTFVNAPSVSDFNPIASSFAVSPTPKMGKKNLHVGLVVGAVVACIVAVTLVLTSGSKVTPYFNKDIQYGKFIDPRDQQEYRTVMVGDEEWFAQNLNYATSNSVCDTCELYGRLYNYADAMIACPAGWTVPAFADMVSLFSENENVFISPKKLLSQKLAGTDVFGFSGITSGFYSFKDNVIKRRGEVFNLWLYDETDNLALRAKIDGSKSMLEINPLAKDYGFSVRCVRQNQTHRDDSKKILIDTRDSHFYSTAMIGGRNWMTMNLRYRMPQSYCYGDDKSNCSRYGRLYTWDAANVACPIGWHLPNNVDLSTLLSYVGSSGVERSLNLRAGSFANGMDKFGFSVLPAGSYDSIGKAFYGLDNYASFWTSTENNDDFAYYLNIYINDVNIYNNVKTLGYSVRCVQD